MFSFLSTFGPGIITFFTVEKCTHKKITDGIRILLEVIAYAALDAAVATALLQPFGKVEISVIPDGVSVLRYGSTAFIASFFIAVVMGIIISAIKERLKLQIHIITKEENSDEHKAEA